MELINHWTDWREIYGNRGTRHRRQLDHQLETRPMLLYWGDSWFSTPLYRNLARQSARRIDGLGRVVGKPGAMASELFAKRELKRIEKRLMANPFDVMVISAGGNDSLSKRLDRVFDDWTANPGSKAKITADEAFAVLQNANLFDGILSRYQALMEMAAKVQSKRPNFRVVGHGYAPLKRIGVAGDLTTLNIGILAWLKDDVGPWLWRPMQHVLIDHAAAQDFAFRLLVDGFRDQVLKPIAADHPGLFDFADFSALPAARTDAFWFDEIHPTEAGFAQIAPLLNQRIRDALPAAKQAAIG